MKRKEIPPEDTWGKRMHIPDPTENEGTIEVPDTAVQGFGEFQYPRVADPRDLPDKQKGQKS